MRLLSLLLLATLPFAGYSERFIFTPTGGKLLNNVLRIEAFARRGDDYPGFIVGTGVGTSFDVEAGFEKWHGDGNKGFLNFSYNFVVPIPDIGPGISIGVQDIAGETRRGRGVYVATTWKFNNFDPWNQNTPTEFTLGAGSGRYKGIFLSGRMPLSDRFRLVLEHDSQEITVGLELIPVRQSRLWVLVQGSRPTLGLSTSIRF